MTDADDTQTSAGSRLSREELLTAILTDGPQFERALDALTDAVVAALAVPTALVSLVDREHQYFLGQTGAPPAAQRGTPISHSFCRHIVPTGEPLVIEDAPNHPLVSRNPAIRDLGILAYAGQPIVLNGHTLGSLCVTDHQLRAWTPREVTTLRRFADLVEFLIQARLSTVQQLVDREDGARARDQQQSSRLAVYKALADEQDQVQALNRRLQRALLATPTAPVGVDIEVFYRPGSDRLLLGGDFVDTAQAGEQQLAFIVGDVTGHGPEAAALAISLRSAWHALQSVGIGLDGIVQMLDAQAADSELFATVVIGHITADGHLRLLSAGHPTPIVAGAAGARELIDDPGPMLGIGIDPGQARWPTVEHQLSGQTLLVYTDGLIEGRLSASRERFGTERLLDAVTRHGPSPDRLHAAAAAASGGSLPDDVAILRIQPGT